MAPAEPPIPLPQPTALPYSPRFHVEIDLRTPPVCLRPKKLLIHSAWIALLGLVLFLLLFRLVDPIASSSEAMTLLAAASFSSLLLSLAAAALLALHDHGDRGFSWIVPAPGGGDCEVVVREAGGGDEEAISWIISFETAKAPPLVSSYDKAVPSKSTEAEPEASVEVVLLVAAEAALPSSA